MIEHLDYFIFAGADKHWVAYCPSNRLGNQSKKITILGNSQLLSNSLEYILVNYNDDMSSICKKCPKFTLHTKGKLYTKKEEIFIENENYIAFKSKITKEYFIKVGGKEDRKWIISSPQNEIHTTNNIKILNKCETIIRNKIYKNSIKAEGFFCEKSNMISPIRIF